MRYSRCWSKEHILHIIICVRCAHSPSHFIHSAASCSSSFHTISILFVCGFSHSPHTHTQDSRLLLPSSFTNYVPHAQDIYCDRSERRDMATGSGCQSHKSDLAVVWCVVEPRNNAPIADGDQRWNSLERRAYCLVVVTQKADNGDNRKFNANTKQG